MKIKFANLGSIKETELDLRPLTVIIGPNNSSKTYIAYSVYGIMWRNLSAYSNLSHYFTEACQKQKVNDVCRLELDDSFVKVYFDNIKQETTHFQQTLTDFFQDSTRQLFSNATFEIIFSPADREKITASLESRISDKPQTLEITQQAASDALALSYQQKLFSRAFLLPAERNTLVTNYKILSYRRFKLLEQTRYQLFSNQDNALRSFDSLRESGDIRYPQPIEDFLNFLVEIDFQTETQMEIANPNAFQKLADLLETHIQNRHRTILKTTLLGSKEIKVQIKPELSIDLYNASSSIKQLAPLLLYLRYRAKTGDLLIIDEPEMNLHPESQAKLLEILAMLVNLGIKVLITTHSSYFMAHLNNLIHKDTGNATLLQKQATSLYLKEPHAFLPLDWVSAYEMKDNQLVSLLDKEENCISWNTLSDVSFDIQRKYFELDEIEEAMSCGKENR